MEYLRTIQAGDDEARRTLRAVGALLLGVGVLVLAVRRSAFEDPWGDFALFLLALLPALFLYGGGLFAARNSAERSAWHAVFVVFGLIFVPLALLRFIDLVGGDTGASLNVVWVFGVTAALGALAALIAGIRFGMLAAGLAFIVSWFALWDAILGEDFSADAGTIRGFAMLAAAVLLVAAAGLHWLRRGRHFRTPLVDEHFRVPAELITAAGVAFLVGAGILSAMGAIVQGVVSTLGPLAPQGVGGFAEPSVFWDAALLVGSLALVALGAWFAVRGPVYVGGAGLAIFVVLVGLDLDDSSPSGSVVGWPLLLLIVAAIALAASVLAPARTAGPPAANGRSGSEPGSPPAP